MTIRQMIQSGIKFEGALRVVRYDAEADDYEVFYSSLESEHMLLTTEHEDMLDREILMMVPVDGVADIPQIQIEVA